MDDPGSHRSGPHESATTSGPPVLPSDAPLDAELPPDLQVALARFLGTESITTLAAWTRSLRELVGDGTITVDSLCLTTQETPHRGVMDGELHYFACFYDAVILAAIAEQPVDVRTKRPEGVEITARANGSDVVDVDPPEAVFSFGIDRHVDPPGEDGPSASDGYDAICPYVKAFPDADAYRSWARTVPAPTVALPLAGATELATSLDSNTGE